MNALLKLVVNAGQKVNERMYEAVWRWGGKDYPCTHGDILINPPLILGGYSPHTVVVVSVRTQLFGNGPFPVKDQECALTTRRVIGPIAMKVGTIEISAGDVVRKMECVSVDQGA
jgi:hypothetical protein